jgi:hypothetical protein
MSQMSNYKKNVANSSVSPTRSAIGLASLSNPTAVFEQDEVFKLKKEWRIKENEYETKIALLEQKNELLSEQLRETEQREA